MTQGEQDIATILLGILNIVAIIIGWCVVYYSTKRLQKMKAAEGLCFNLIDQLSTLKEHEHDRPILGNRLFLADVNRVSRCIAKTAATIAALNHSKQKQRTLERLRRSQMSLRQIYSLDNPDNTDESRIERASIEICEIQGLIYSALTDIH